MSSLERLGVDRVGLYLAHDFDPEHAAGGDAAGVRRARAAGKVGAVGASNFSGEQLAEAVELSELEGLPRYEWVQNGFSLLDQADREDVFPVCREHGLGYTPFSPLAGGWLTGKYRRGEPPPPGSRMTLRPEPYADYSSDRVFDALEWLEAEATTRGVSMAGLALAWLLAVDEVTGIVVGPGRADHLAPALEALSISLTTDRARLSDGGLLMSVLVLSEHDVRTLLDMESCIAAMEDVLARLARDELINPLRTVMRSPGPALGLGLMPAYAGGSAPVFSLKEIVVAPSNSEAGSTLIRDRCSSTTAMTGS